LNRVECASIPMWLRVLPPARLKKVSSSRTRKRSCTVERKIRERGTAGNFGPKATGVGSCFASHTTKVSHLAVMYDVRESVAEKDSCDPAIQTAKKVQYVSAPLTRFLPLMPRRTLSSACSRVLRVLAQCAALTGHERGTKAELTTQLEIIHAPVHVLAHGVEGAV